MGLYWFHLRWHFESKPELHAKRIHWRKAHLVTMGMIHHLVFSTCITLDRTPKSGKGHFSLIEIFLCTLLAFMQPEVNLYHLNPMPKLGCFHQREKLQLTVGIFSIPKWKGIYFERNYPFSKPLSNLINKTHTRCENDQAYKDFVRNGRRGNRSVMAAG